MKFINIKINFMFPSSYSNAMKISTDMSQVGAALFSPF